MPILYQSNKINETMTTTPATEVTRAELDIMATHHRKMEYTANEQEQVFGLVRKYINPHQATCATCSNNLRDAKTQLNEFYLRWKNDIELILLAQQMKANEDFTENKKQSKNK